MSIRESVAAMYAAISPASKLLLFFMGECCGDDDDCHTSIEFLVAHTRMSPDKVMMLLKDLERDGFITYRGHSSKAEGREAFWIHTSRLEAMKVAWDVKRQAVAA